MNDIKCPDCGNPMFEIDYDEHTQIAEWQCWDCQLVQYFKNSDLIDDDDDGNFARGLLTGLALSTLFYGAVAYLIWGR